MPFGGEQPEDQLVAPLALDQLDLAQVRFWMHPEAGHQGGGLAVAGIAAAHDPVQLELVESDAEQFGGGGPGEALAVVIGMQREPDLTLPVVVGLPGQHHLADQGIGISVEDQQQLFRRFFRSRNAIEQAVPGTGLGLSLVRSIVDAHGGTVSVTSELGVGTTFTVRLPLVAR